MTQLANVEMIPQGKVNAGMPVLHEPKESSRHLNFHQLGLFMPLWLSKAQREAYITEIGRYR